MKELEGDLKKLSMRNFDELVKKVMKLGEVVKDRRYGGRMPLP